jgi:uroporphyrinogen-III decarboxylase
MRTLGSIGFHLPDEAVILLMGISFVRPPASSLGEAVHLMEMLHPLAGIEDLNPVQPECMDLEAVASRYQDRLAFCGMIGTQTTMPFGTPDDVCAAVERCRRLHENGARVIVAPTHVLEPDVPWENIIAFIEAVRP